MVAEWVSGIGRRGRRFSLVLRNYVSESIARTVHSVSVNDNAVGMLSDPASHTPLCSMAHLLSLSRVPERGRGSRHDGQFGLASTRAPADSARHKLSHHRGDLPRRRFMCPGTMRVFLNRESWTSIRSGTMLKGRTARDAMRPIQSSRDIPTGLSCGRSAGEGGSKGPAAAAWQEFVAASDVSEITSKFTKLLKAVQCEGLVAKTAMAGPGPIVLRTLAEAAPRLPPRMKELVQLLSRRQAHTQYRQGEACAGLRTAIIGAGPVGLRCALELSLCGSNVIVIEGRAAWTRLNVLHLWSWVEADLTELGVKLLDPSVFAAAEFCHTATAQLQRLLLKLCLFVGVTLRTGCTVNRLDEHFRTTLQRLSQRPEAEEEARTLTSARPGEGLGSAALGRSMPSLHSLHHSLHSTSLHLLHRDDAFPCDLLVDATGARCTLFNDLGFSQVTMLKGARSLGIVCHLAIASEAWEARLSEGSWASQYHQQRFGRLASEKGVALQNLVYYQQPHSSHYFVMTAEADALVRFGAIRSKGDGLEGAALVKPPNVDLVELERFARIAINEFVPGLEERPLLPKQLQLFDFSERKQSNAAALVVPLSAVGGSAVDRRLLVTRVGDALQEPFW